MLQACKTQPFSEGGPATPQFHGSFQPLTPHLYNVPSRQPADLIADYGLIGDCRSAALVSRNGSIDWLCFPRFDSPSIFAAILDPERGGYWSISPCEPFDAARAYINDSNVLETKFTCSTGSATLTDLMPVGSEEFKRRQLVPDHEILREVRCTRGSIEIETRFCPGPDYGAAQPRLRVVRNIGIYIDEGRGAYWLRSSIPLKVSKHGAHVRFSLSEGEVAQFSLTYAEESPAVLPSLRKTRDAIERSVSWWQQWAARNRYQGPYRDSVVRSALVLKLLTYAPSGAVIAAPTTSLPERIGDSLNWDYRFCWLRDASLTIRAMLGLAYMDEAESFLTWMLTATRLTQPELRVLYTVFGRKAPRESTLSHLSGFLDSRPVRIGNGARDQLQLDIYGEIVESTAQYSQHLTHLDVITQKVLVGLGQYVAEHWDLPDEGIWEPRSGRAHNTHSKLMCWTALDRLLALSDKGLLHNIPKESFMRERDRIRQQIETRAWNESLETYVSVLDGNELDASLLRIPWYGFERADSPRMKSTYRAVQNQLGAGDGLLYRYQRTPPEGAFGICGFWAVEQLALCSETLDDAHKRMRSLLKYENDLGLFAEEVDPQTGQALGNFPQGFTHIGLISAALTIAEQERGKSHPAIKVGSDVEESRTEAKA